MHYRETTIKSTSKGIEKHSRQMSSKGLIAESNSVSGLEDNLIIIDSGSSNGPF